MATSLIAHTAASSSNTTSVTSPAIDAAGASLIVIYVASYSSNPADIVSDSEGNTWQPLTASPTGNADTIGQFFYCSNPAAGSAQTFSATSASGGCYPSIFVEAFTGASGSPDIAVSGGTTNPPIQPGSGTPAHDNELLITGITVDSTATLSVDSGFNVTDQLPVQAGIAYGGAMAYLIQTTATAEDPSWTGSGLVGIAAMASWQGTGSGAPQPGTVTLSDAPAYTAGLASAAVYTAALGDAPLYTVVLSDE